MQFQIGEKVVFLREAGGGIIRRIEGNKIFVEDETGFDRPFSKTDIAKIHGTEYSIPENESFLLQLSDGTGSNHKTTSKPVSAQKDYWEIDLHLEELAETYGAKISRNQEQALEKQMAVFKEFYYKARKKKVRKLIVIHGFGKGILREELHIFLKGQDGVDFFDAPYIEYGHGATQVEIRYNY